jgi:hypothetical protein
VIVLIVHQFDVSADELKRNPPAPAHPHRPNAFALAFERVKTQPGQVHISGGRGYGEPTEYEPQPLGVLSLNARLGAVLEEAGQALVFET